LVKMKMKSTLEMVAFKRNLYPSADERKSFALLKRSSYFSQQKTIFWKQPKPNQISIDLTSTS